jgi:membrane-bound metal-dependent hydrolase YbcI (DUF457 family)
MDTITHGIAGALIGKSLFKGDDLFAKRPMNRERIVTWATMLGAIFPDSDTFRNLVSRNDLLVITWHRSITHSLVCLPVFALLLAALTRWIARWRKWDAPSFTALVGIYAVGILSHILLDLVTSFGTMVWSPFKWSRPAWDLIYIVDFTFAGILLVPQILAWVHERPEKSTRRALVSFMVFVLALFAVQKIAEVVGAPISAPSVFLFFLILAALFLLPLRGAKEISKGKPAESNNPGAHEPTAEQATIRRRWNTAGLVCGVVYVALAAMAHHAALGRVKNFAVMQKLEVQTLGALPWPPSLWRWDGLVRTPRGVYELRMDLTQKSAFEATANEAQRLPIEYRFYPEVSPNVYIEAAKELPAVQKVLWFDRFPVTRYREENGESVVEFADMRFAQVRTGRAAPFTYRVRFGPAGNVLSQGWAK